MFRIAQDTGYARQVDAIDEVSVEESHISSVHQSARGGQGELIGNFDNELEKTESDAIMDRHLSNWTFPGEMGEEVRAFLRKTGLLASMRSDFAHFEAKATAQERAFVTLSMPLLNTDDGDAVWDGSCADDEEAEMIVPNETGQYQAAQAYEFTAHIKTKPK